MRHSMAGICCALCLSGAGTGAAAVDRSAAAVQGDAGGPKIEFGFDIGVDRAHQTFENSDADLTTVSFAPRLSAGNWELSLDLPWQHAEGEYFVNGNYPPEVNYFCRNLVDQVNGAPRYLNYLLDNPALRAAQRYADCQAVIGTDSVDDSVSGIGDATLLLRYGLPLDGEGIWLLSVAGGYKFDNGDHEKNLGSGTRNTLLEATLGASYRRFTGSVTAGYAWIDATDNDFAEAHYGYALVDAGIRLLDRVTLGCSWSSDESYFVDGETIEKITVYARVKPFERIGIKVYASDYGDTLGYPDAEYGASLYYSY